MSSFIIQHHKLDEVLKKKLDYEYSLTLNKITLCREYYVDKARLMCQAKLEECARICEENMDKLVGTISYSIGRISNIETKSYADSFRN